MLSRRTIAQIATFFPPVGNCCCAPGLLWLTFVVLLLTAPGVNDAAAALPSISLRAVFPPGGKAGTQVEVSVEGANLDDATALVFSHPGISSTAKTAPASEFLTTERSIPGRFLVRIADDVPPGFYEVRVRGRFGLSNPRVFSTGTADEIVAAAENFSHKGALEIAHGTVINGRTTQDRVSYFKFSAQEGQRLIVECWGQRIDSKIEPVLLLWAPDGRRIKRVPGTVGRDPILDVVASENGDYVLGLHDTVYLGGSSHFFRLSLTTGPRIDFVWPPVGIPGSTGPYEVFGRLLPGGQIAPDVSIDGVPLQRLSVEITLPDDEAARRQLAVGTLVEPHRASVDATLYRLASPNGVSNAVPIGYASAPISLEVEPNNDPSAPQKVTVPCEFIGKFFPRGDWDWLEFDATKGEVYWIDVLAHRIGAAVDPGILIQKVNRNEQGEETVTQVATVDDSGASGVVGATFDTRTTDPVYRLSVDQAGSYRVGIRDLFNTKDDPRQIYRLIIRQAYPDFRLVAYSHRANGNERYPKSTTLRRGQAVIMHVDILRQDGFAGDVVVSAEGLPEGVSTSGTTLRGNMKTGSLILEASVTAPAWAGTIRIVGRATVDGQQRVRYARGGSLLWTTKNAMEDPPRARVIRDIGLSVVEDKFPVTVKLANQPVLETSLGATLEVPVRLARRGDYKTEFELSPVGLPGEMNAQKVKLAHEDGKLALTLANEKIGPGVYSFFLRGKSTFTYVRNVDAVKTAEEEQSQLKQVVEKLTVEAQQAEQQKATAAKAAQDAPRKLQEAEKAVTDLVARLERAKKAKEATDKRLNEVRNANQPAETEFDIISAPLHLHVAPVPVVLEIPKIENPLRSGGKLTVPVLVKRKYGFADGVELTLDPPQGISASPVQLAQDQSEAQIEITAEAGVPAGEHAFTLRAKLAFNGRKLEATRPFTVQVVE